MDSLMRVVKVEVSETPIIQRILQIHDEMPRAWDPSHFVSKEYLEGVLARIQSSQDPHGFWILTRSDILDADAIDGLIWAKLMTSPTDGSRFCSVNSFWMKPELRKEGLAVQLSEACLRWARENQAARIECSTHFTNARMREILEKFSFKPGMVQYSLSI
ncbi:MAG: GNAT family N-acetyltransferase [Bdellovibrionia bacterium]